MQIRNFSITLYLTQIFIHKTLTILKVKKIEKRMTFIENLKNKLVVFNSFLSRSRSHQNFRKDN